MIEAMNAAPGPGSQTSESVEYTLKDFVASRPRRPRRGRKIAGVSVAIGNRYAIDPVIVRITFVVTTFIGGAGLLAYLLGWLLFPQEGDEVSAAESLCGQGRSSTSHGLTIALCIALIPVAGAFLGSGSFIALALLVAGLYLLHRSRGNENRPVTPPTGTDHATAQPQTNAGGRQNDEPSSAARAQQATAAHGAWDPLGASPFGWGFAEQKAAPAAQEQQIQQRSQAVRPRIGIITVALALLTAAAGTALNLAGSPWFSPQNITGLTLAVIGLGLLAGSVLGGGRGLIALAVPASLVGLVLTSIPVEELPRGGVGNIDAAPRSASDVQQHYQRSAGNIDLDLTRLSDSVTLDTRVDNYMGNATVLVPTEADVTLTCRSAMGNVDCLGQREEGFGSEVSATDRGDGDGDRQRITLDVQSRMGNVEVRRG